MKNRLKNTSGVALVLVLWVITLLSVIAGEFCHVMRTESLITGNFMEDAQAYYIAHAGVSMGISGVIQNMVNLPVSQAEPASHPASGLWRVHAKIPPITFAQGYVELRIENESGKVNLNEADENMLHMLFSMFHIEENLRSILVDSVLDWRDEDNFHRLNGAENDYYQSLPRPYSCKNADFDAIEELLLVRGMTQEIFYGGLQETVTAFTVKSSSAASAAPFAGMMHKQSNRININAASPKLLRALPQMTDELANAIEQYRLEKDFVSVNDLAAVIGPDAYRAMYPYISLNNTPFYTISSAGRIENSETRRAVRALVEIDLQIPDKYRILQWRDHIGVMNNQGQNWGG